MFFPTTGTLNAGSVHLADPLQLSAPLQVEMSRLGLTESFYLALSLGIFKGNFNPCLILVLLADFKTHLLPSVQDTTFLEGQG